MKYDTELDYMWKEFPRRLRAARLARGLTQVDLAKRARFGNPSAVSLFETGKIKPSSLALCRLADALRVTTDYLLGRSSNMDMATDDAAAASCLHKLYGGLSIEHQDLVDEFVWMLDARRKPG